MSLLPIETLREKIGYHPYHFYQIADNDLLRLSSECNTLVKQRAYYSADQVGRSEIQQAIDDAERQLRNYLGYNVAPKWETATITKGYCYQHSQSVTLPSGKLLRIGTPAWAVLDTASVDYQDRDGDGINEYFEAVFTVTSALYILDDLAARFQVSDCPASWQGQELEIKPVKIEQVDDVTIKVSGSAWMMIAPQKYEGFAHFGNTLGGFLPDTSVNFVQTIELWQRTITNVGQATLNVQPWNGYPAQSFTLNTTAILTESSVVDLSNQSCGIYGFWPCNCNATGRASQSLTISYESGANIEDWETVVVRLALAELRSRICACESANMEIGRWQTDVARTASGNVLNGNGENFRVDTPTLGNPFGTRAGAVYAYNAVKYLALVKAVGTASY